MKNLTPVKEKAFKQISFSRDFVAEVTTLAEAADRSAAKHIEHCVRIAQAIEQILPSGAVQALKAGSMPAAELLAGLAAVLTNPGQSIGIRRTMSANPIRVAKDPSTPDGYIRFNADGSQTPGNLNDDGEFVARSSTRRRDIGEDSHDPSKEKQKTASRSAAASATPERRTRKAVSTA